MAPGARGNPAGVIGAAGRAKPDCVVSDIPGGMPGRVPPVGVPSCCGGRGMPAAGVPSGWGGRGMPPVVVGTGARGTATPGWVMGRGAAAIGVGAGRGIPAGPGIGWGTPAAAGGRAG